MREASLCRPALSFRRDDFAGVSKDEDERSEGVGEEANPDLASLFLLPSCVVSMLLLDGVRVGFGLFAERAAGTGFREDMAESDVVFLPRGRLLGPSDRPGSASERSLALLVCGVWGGAVLRRGGCSRIGDWRSRLSLSLRASEFRALDAALTDIGEGRLCGYPSPCLASPKSALTLLSGCFTGLRVRGVVSLRVLLSHALYNDSVLLHGCSEGAAGLESERDSS